MRFAETEIQTGGRAAVFRDCTSLSDFSSTPCRTASHNCTQLCTTVQQERVSWVSTVHKWRVGTAVYPNAGTRRVLRADVILAICPLRKGAGGENDEKEREGGTESVNIE